VLDGQETAKRTAKVSLPVGVCCTDHLRPFQRTAPVPPRPVLPTAVHATGELQEMASTGHRIRCDVHLEPLQRSTKFATVSVASPTAMQRFLRGQDTPVSSTPVLAGAGGYCDDQAKPFQRSANGIVVPSVASADPTAVQAVMDEHESA
jgi:hypothetical protein